MTNPMFHDPLAFMNSSEFAFGQQFVRQRCHVRLAILVAVALSSNASLARAQPQPAHAWSEISRLAREVADAPPKGDAASLAADQQDLLASLERVDKGLLPSKRGGDAWRGFLRLEQIRQLATTQNTVDQAQLDACCRRLRSALVVWPKPELRSLQASLDRYARDARVLLDADYECSRITCLQQLADRLDALDQSPSPEDLRQIAELCGWLMQREEATPVVDALEAIFLKPNFIVRLSQNALDRELRTPIDENFAVNATYVDTPVQGRANIQGTVKPQLATVGDTAAIDLLLDARTIARTSGINSGVSVTTTGRTSIRGIKRILISPTGLQPLEAAANATAAVYFDNVNAGGGRFGAQASSQVYGSRARAESESAAEAKNGAKARLDQMARTQIEKINEPFRRNIVYPLLARDAWPRSFTTAVQDGQLRVEAVEAAWNEYGPFGAPLGLASSSDASLQVHVSGIERFARDMLGGRTWRGQEFGDFLATLPSTDKPVPTSKQTSSEELPEPTSVSREKPADWSLTFDKQQPLTVEINQGLIRIVMRLSQFQSDGKSFPAMKIKLNYRTQLDHDAVHFVRDGAMTVLPIGFVSGIGERLTGPQHVVCKILARRMEGVLSPQYELRSLFFDQAFSRLKMASLEADQGWLSIGMRLEPDTLSSTP